MYGPAGRAIEQCWRVCLGLTALGTLVTLGGNTVGYTPDAAAPSSGAKASNREATLSWECVREWCCRDTVLACRCRCGLPSSEPFEWPLTVRAWL